MTKTTLRRLREMKDAGEPIAALGVYDAAMARIADGVGFELFVTGNSGAMCLLGRRGATEVPAVELLAMSRAVSRMTRRALVVGTLPFGSYAASRRDAVRAGVTAVTEGGADAVQCHGTRATAPFIQAIVEAGIPVLAHVGLQSVRQVAQSGFGVKGRSAEEARAIIADALALVEAGVFGLIVEAVPTELCGWLRRRLPVPVLSLGSGADADGVYLVAGDATGYSVFPKPARAGRFTDVRPVMAGALADYVAKARARRYPASEDTRSMEDGEFSRFMATAG